jgi:hypothetical protein
VVFSLPAHDKANSPAPEAPHLRPHKAKVAVSTHVGISSSPGLSKPKRGSGNRGPGQAFGDVDCQLQPAPASHLPCSWRSRMHVKAFSSTFHVDAAMGVAVTAPCLPCAN